MRKNEFLLPNNILYLITLKSIHTYRPPGPLGFEKWLLPIPFLASINWNTATIATLLHASCIRSWSIKATPTILHYYLIVVRDSSILCMHPCDLASSEVQYRLWAVKRCEKRLFCVGYLQTSSIDFVVCEPLRPNPRLWQKQNANRSNTFHKTSKLWQKIM